MKKITLLFLMMLAFSFGANAQAENDLCSGAIAIEPSAQGTGCATFTFTAPASTDGTTDSGVPTVCSDPGLDIWFTWTATSTGLVYNDGTGNPGIAIYASCADATAGTSIDCENTFAGVDAELSGWNIGDELLIQIYDFAGSTSDLSFCLEEFTPPPPPECTTNLVATPDATCGSLGTVVTWDAEATATGYNITVGTTPGGSDVLNNVNIGNVLTYTIEGQMTSTTYYWTVSPFNNTGAATGCVENTYTTIAAACYCTSTTTSIDGTGIGALQVGTTDFTSGGTLSYEDFTGAPVDLGAGITSNVQITFQTGYTYGVNIWIDFNDDLTFDASEEVYTGGESLATNPTTFDASFVMPAAAAVGTHRMRIVTDDTNADALDPCNSTTWHVTMDVDVNIVIPSCSPPVATAAIAPDCGSTQFFIDVDVTDLGNGSPAIFDGTATTPVAATGIVSVGPYADGASVTLTLQHGSDPTCDLPLGAFTFSCPPVNDDIANATPITIGEMICDGTTNNGTNVAATYSGEGEGGCYVGTGSPDVWYTFTVAADSSVDVSTDYLGGTLIDTQIAIFSGTPGALVEVACSQDEGVVILSNGSSWNSLITGQAVTAGTYYVQVSGYNGTNFGTFCLSVDMSPPANDECANAEALMFGVEVSADNTNATDSGVASTCNPATVADLWYSFVAGTGLEVEITTTAANYTVYSDCAGTEVSCNTSLVTGLTDGATYYISVTDDGTARSQAPGAFTLTVSEPTASLDEFNADSLFSYYPNPVNDNLTLKAQKEISNVSVYNMIGQEVYRNAPNTLTNEVNMTSLQAGAYFVKVTVGNVTETIKVIKN